MGIGIEIIQEFFTTTRKADVWDVVANFSGAITSGLLIWMLEKKKIFD